jgi:hypothetical protein
VTGGVIADFRETVKAFPVKVCSGFTSGNASEQKGGVFSHSGKAEILWKFR